jgi:hypothetical protein
LKSLKISKTKGDTKKTADISIKTSVIFGYTNLETVLYVVLVLGRHREIDFGEALPILA